MIAEKLIGIAASWEVVEWDGHVNYFLHLHLSIERSHCVLGPAFEMPCLCILFVSI